MEVPVIVPPWIVFPSIVHPWIWLPWMLPKYTFNPWWSRSATTWLSNVFTVIFPLRPNPLPPTSNTPPRILSASIVPAVIKSATRFPSIVQAFLYGPLIPVVEKPMPFLLSWIMLLALFLSGLSIIKILHGSLSLLLSSSMSNRTYPPLPPVISWVAFSTLFCISLLMEELILCTALENSSFSFADILVKVLILSPNVILLFSGFSISISYFLTKKSLSTPWGLLTTRIQSPNWIFSMSTSTMCKSTADNSIVKERFTHSSKYAFAFFNKFSGWVSSNSTVSQICPNIDTPALWII